LRQKIPAKCERRHALRRRLQSGEYDEDDQDAQKQAATIGDGIDDGVFVELTAGGDQPETADPEEQDRDQEPETVGVPVELGGVEVGDVEGEHDDGGIATGSAEAAELFDVGDLVAAATCGRAATFAEIFEFGEAFDEGEGEKEEDAEAGKPGGDDDSGGGRTGDDADGVEAGEDDDVYQRGAF